MISKIIKIRSKALLLILLMVFTGIYSIIVMNIPNSSISNIKEIENENDSNNELFLKEKKPKSAYGTHDWWNKAYHSRQVINITNPYSEKLYNYPVSISFNYTEKVLEGNMRSDLGDIRIIEVIEGEQIQRKYYFQKDFKDDHPEDDWVTVWFEMDINVTNDASQLDTYLYYGNDAASIDTSLFMNETTSDSVDSNFGWIRNGNFEQDPGVIGDHTIDGVFGWYYADDVPDDVDGPYTPDTPHPTDYQHNLSIYQGGQELHNEGTYTFKFGDITHSVEGGGTGKDLAGTLFSAPFVVPTVSGGSNKIYINAWRNFRTHDSQNAKKIGVYVRIAHFYSSTNVNSHEAYGSAAYTEGYVEKWQSYLSDPREESLTDSTLTINKNTATGDLTGNLTIDVSGYQGEAIFLEFGMFDYDGEDKNKYNAFCQVDNVTFTYDLEVTLDSNVERRKSDVTIIVRDVDGRIVPNAEVSIINSSKPSADQILYGPLNTSENNGSVLFTSVNYRDYYNITVNYTIVSTGFETVVYNSSEIGGDNFNITESQHEFTIYVDIWTIDFEIVDYDKEPLNYGYIAIYNETENGENLENITLDAVDGKSTFRWRNQSSYYYKVYYENYDYNLHNTTLLNHSYIYRSVYESEKIQEQSVYLNEGLPETVGSNVPFTVNRTFYTNGSKTELGNKKIISANISIATDAYVNTISIYYIDKNDYTEENENYLIFSNTSSPGKPWYRPEIDMRTPRSEAVSTLEGDNYEVYGLRIVINGTNSTNILGNLNVTFYETTNIYNVTTLSKLIIRVVGGEYGSYEDFPGAVTVIVNSSIESQNFFVNLTTFQAPFLNGYAYGEINQIPLWYKRGYEYNISLYWNDQHRKLNVTYTDPDDPYKGEVLRNYYNFTLNQKSNITLFCDTSGADPGISELLLNNLIVVSEVTWGENFSVQVNFTKTDDGSYYSPVTTDETVTCYIKSASSESIVLEKPMISPGNDGIFNISFNSSKLSAGGSGKYYFVIISGERNGWGIGYASNISQTIFIKSIETTLSMHNYYSPSLNVISETSAKFGQITNLTFSFYNISRLKGATLTYKWLGLDPIQFYEDPVNERYYTATINTSLAEVWGTRTFEIVAKLENYTTQTLLISLSITERPTTLNGETDLVYINSKVWVEDPNPFIFSFQDSTTEEYIANLTTSTYTWEKLYANGTRIPGESGIGNLNQNSYNSHTLDFHTEIKPIGNYYLYATLHKQNYMAKSALINLEILSREFSYTLQPGKIIDGIMEIENGDPIDLSISLQDLTRNISLEGATIETNYQDTNYIFTEEGNGIYSINITDYTRLDEDETSETKTTAISISKANFTTQIIDVTILLNNRRFNYTFSEEFSENIVKVVSGDRLSFDVTLINSKDQSPIVDGNITLTIKGQTYEDLIITNNGDGTYTFSFLSYPEAFTSTKTLSGEITIQRTNYKTETIPITIEIKMTEIFPGMPTFYFIILVVSIVGVLGSIVAYRVIQQARIPKHVKKIRKVKGLIKAKKQITEIISVPSKDEMFAKLFGNDWKQIDLSIEKSLRIEELKKQPTIKEPSIKQPIIKDKIKEQRGDIE